ncbi:MAG TPA: DnaJ domain-containing protein [Thermoguttaceae bacterium]|nr:DnaJ domain-containing protein [Thermoguttaceae bacterium]
MPDPYEVLDLPPESGDAEIRRRYLELVRRHPPDRDPERFAAIRRAYDELRDPQKRMESRLFRMETDDSLDAIVADVKRRFRAARIPTETLLHLVEKR